MQKTKDIQLDTFVIVTHGVKGTNLFVTDQGLLNRAKQVIYKRILNSGCIGYFIDRKFRAESKLIKYPITQIIHIKPKMPF